MAVGRLIWLENPNAVTTAKKYRTLKLHPDDNVIVALEDLPQNETVHCEGVAYHLPHGVAAKHKFMTEERAPNDPVRMYGVLVGKATRLIKRGEALTTFNLKHDAQGYSVAQKKPYLWPGLDVEKWQKRTFMGYHRADGRVGIRNYWLVIPMVFCENRNIAVMKDAFERELGFAQPETYRNQVRQMVNALINNDLNAIDAAQLEPEIDRRNALHRTLFPNVDGIKFLTHDMGCGGTNQDSHALNKLFAGFVANPNVAGVTVLSLGCQKSQFDDLMLEINQHDPGFAKPVLYFDQQTYGSEQAMMSVAIRDTFKGLIEINLHQRQPAPLSKLNVGLKCGGSDGFSGLSANPAVGHLSDVLGCLGGTTLLAEFPELCGVEQELINRCESIDSAHKFVELYDQYAQQAVAVNAGFDMNPSVGNIKDGLITDAIKSAGAAKKGGSAPITGVLDYAEQPTKSGLHLLCTPGNDVLATTGMAASGANIILFTTGLGTPTGNPVTPTVKISTNTRLAQKMADIIDFDSGTIIAGHQSIEQNAEALLEWLIELASGGHQTHAERLGQDDFIPWRRGVNL